MKKREKQIYFDFENQIESNKLSYRDSELR